ncbi:MAG: type II secretion system major pseudopilin GspG [Salinisphaeraceae bacterium]|nr:type II secretion system major pseudopilin GspG [Salinisphaeraceae bacterium]
MQKSRVKNRRQRGFTLIEIMVVVVILGILAAIAVPRIMSRPDTARITKAKQDIRVVENALKLYRLDNFNYPSTDQGLEALVRKPSGDPEAKNWNPDGYLDRLPKDPWGNPYQYLSPGVKNENGVDIYTLGADARPGGEGPNADIGNWNLEDQAQ